MHIRKRSTCSTPGCGQQAFGKEHCRKHAASARMAGIELKSSCCGAACVAGTAHEYGEQYCKKCGNACMWKA